MRIETEMLSVIKIVTAKEIKAVTPITTGKPHPVQTASIFSLTATANRAALTINFFA
jgi:hypothetical protein